MAFCRSHQSPENKGTDAKGLAQRFGYVINGLIYAGLAFTASKLALGTGGNSNSNSTQDWTASILSQPFGQSLIGTVGAFIIGFAFYQFYQAFSNKIRKRLNLTELSNTERKWVMTICRFGVAARGVVFCIIGWFLIKAATQYDPTQAGGLDRALQTLAQQPYGPWLLGIVALGLIAYGVYMVVQARYSQLATN